MLTRRTLLLGSAAAVVLTGCAAGGAGTSTAGSSVATVAGLLATTGFVAAHRGSGDNWPEHTLTAYRNALTTTAAQAVEISVHATSDNVLVCLHDDDTGRVTGVAGAVAQLTYAQLADRPVNARAWLGDATGAEPIPRLADVLAALPSDCLAFVEDKTGVQTSALLDLLDAQPNAKNRFIWKQWAGGKQVAAAKQRGYTTWGYFTAEIIDKLDTYAADFDALGITIDADDAAIARFVATGKPVIVWEVHTRSQRARLLGLGVRGLMCSNVPYLTGTDAIARATSFGTGRRAAGDLPSGNLEVWNGQPELIAGTDSVKLTAARPGYCLGSFAPITATSYTLSCTVAWTGEPVASGLAFGLPDDAAYSPTSTNAHDALQLIFTDGRVALAYHRAGQGAATSLAQLSVAASGSLTATVQVSASQLVLGCAGKSVTVEQPGLAGGYLWLWTTATAASGVQLGPVSVA